MWRFEGGGFRGDDKHDGHLSNILALHPAGGIRFYHIIPNPVVLPPFVVLHVCGVLRGGGVPW